MSKILLSIKKEYADKILNGTKKYEYRKVLAYNVKTIVIYVTWPIKKVVGEVEVIYSVTEDKNDLWNRSKEYSGITKEFYDEYFKNKIFGSAYRLGEVRIYDKAKDLIDLGIKNVPQSFVYLDRF